MTEKTKTFLVTFIICLLMFLLIVPVVTILGRIDFSKSNYKVETQEVSKTDSSNILIIFEKEKISFYHLRLDFNNQTFLSNNIPDRQFFYNDKVRLFSEVFKKDGITSLLECISDFEKNPFKKYIYFDKQGLCDVIDLLGGIDVWLEEDALNNQGKIIADKGKSRLFGNQVADITFNQKTEEKIVNAISKTFFDIADKNEQKRMFLNIIEAGKSNISYKDFYDKQNHIEKIEGD